jgi:hypothetical protein
MTSDNCSRPHKIKWMQSIALFVICHLSLILVIGCAAQKPPPGGPEDKTPPTIDTTIPHTGQTNVPTNTRVEFRFDRDVDRASFQQAVSVTPYITGTLRFHWSGYDQVNIEFPERLRDSTTYTVQLTRDLKSKRGNQLAVPYRILFSTGPKLDSGQINGFLLQPIAGTGPKASDIFVMAYDLSSQQVDTLDFTHTQPELLTQPNDQGVWQLMPMKQGHRYRFFALSDVYRNHLYDPGVDAFGVPTTDAVMDSIAKSQFLIRMSAMTDTIRPELSDAEVSDSFHLRAHFSEAIDSNDVRTNNATIAGNTIIAAFRESPEKRPGQITYVVPTPLVPNGNYTLQIAQGSIHDLAHNPISDTASKVSFSAPSTVRSATPPAFAGISIRDSAIGIATIPSLLVRFSDAVRHDSAEQSITLLDSLQKNVRTTFKWLDDSRLILSSADSLLSNALYTVMVRTRGIQSPVAALSAPARDTTLRFRFRTWNVRDLAKLSGKISIADSFFTQNPAGALVVQAINSTTTEMRQLILKPGASEYTFDGLPEASYRVRAYFSKSGDAAFDAGSLRPWRFAMPSGDFAQPVSARMRWTTKNIDFEVK